MFRLSPDVESVAIVATGLLGVALISAALVSVHRHAPDVSAAAIGARSC